MRRWLLVLLACVWGCPGKPVPPPVDAQHPDAPWVVPDALPDANASPDAPAVVVSGAAPRRRKSYEVLLRSTPSGALAAVDGRPVGDTPVTTRVADGERAHDFTFTLGGYAMARYKVRVIKSGVVHGMLRRLPRETDAGP